MAERKKVAILGGGISSLAAAFELSSTEEMRRHYDITLYQMGWRLGGKLASGRDQADHNKNVEHGLHVWFGYYENAFMMFKEVFSKWKKPHGCPFQTWEDAFTPQDYTPIGEVIDGKQTYWKFTWPTNADEPGDGQVNLTPWGVMTEIVSVIKNIIFDKKNQFPELKGVEEDLPEWIEYLLDEANPKHLFEEVEAGAANLVNKVLTWMALIDGTTINWHEKHYEGIREVLGHLKDETHKKLESSSDVNKHHFLNIIDIGIAIVRGVLNPEYGIVANGWDLNRINHLEFREWLKKNGGNKNIVDNWSVIKAFYDAWFEYSEGKTTEPNFCAGSGLRVMLRIMLTYKGHVLYLVNSGMGDTVISPFYDVLKEQGVKFKFFHRVKNLKLSPDKHMVDEVEFFEQAKIKGGKEYEPTFNVQGLNCWPSEPFWDQLEDGEKLESMNVNFETKWSYDDFPTTAIKRGSEFDMVVLGLSLGAFKVLNSEPSICQDIIDAVPKFKDMTEKLCLVPSIGIQFWMERDLKGLGWASGKPAMVGWSYPNDVWADMTQVIETEDWSLTNRPGSLGYLCGTFDTEGLYKNPSTDKETIQKATTLGVKATIDQFNKTANSIWPNAASQGQGMNWDELFTTQGYQGIDKLKSQYIRVNVEPTECTVGSGTDTFQYRLKASDSGVVNMYMCGAWLRTGLDSSCVEAAVMSGRQCARAISGVEIDVVGEDWM